MHLVKYHPFNLSHCRRPSVKHHAQYFGGHNKARRLLIDCGVTRYKSHIAERFFEIAILLVGERLDW
jgi:hypothetical protein